MRSHCRGGVRLATTSPCVVAGATIAAAAALARPHEDEPSRHSPWGMVD